MKKVLLSLFVVSALLLTGCEKVSEGNYKPGSYYASVVDNYGGSANTALATIYVDENGKIASVYLDTTYTKNDVVTTKKALGNEYNMKANPNVSLEWYEQVKLLEDKVVEEQGIDFLTLDNNGKTDTVSGCTIKIDALKQALQQALNKARK